MTSLPDSTDFTGSTVTEGGQKTFITNLRSFLAGVLGTAGTAEGARTALGLGSAATAAASSFLAADNNLSDIVDPSEARTNLDVYSKAEVDAAAGGDFQSQIDTMKTNFALTVIRMIANAGSSYMGMVDGWADEFEDTSGIGSLGTATYDASGDYIHNPGQTQVAQDAGTALGNMTYGGGLAAAFDGNTSQASTAASYTGGGVPVAAGYIGKDWGPDNSKIITGFKIWGMTDFGYEAANGSSTFSMTVTLQGSTDNFSASIVDLGSITFNDTASGTNLQEKLTGVTATTAYRYHRLKVIRSDLSSGYYGVSEVQFFEGGPGISNVIVTSITKTAVTDPLQGRITLVVDPQVSITYGTDNRIRMSRDDGTTWVTGTMAVEASNLDFPGGYTVDVVTASFDFTGTPSGTSMQVEWSTFNNKHQLLHAWYPEWRA